MNDYENEDDQKGIPTSTIHVPLDQCLALHKALGDLHECGISALFIGVSRESIYTDEIFYSPHSNYNYKHHSKNLINGIYEISGELSSEFEDLDYDITIKYKLEEDTQWSIEGIVEQEVTKETDPKVFLLTSDSDHYNENLSVIRKTMLENGVDSIEYKFTGGGDSGELTDLVLNGEEDADNESLLNGVVVETSIGQVEFSDLIFSYCDNLSSAYENWWDGEGGGGSVKITQDEVATEIYHCENYTETIEIIKLEFEVPILEAKNSVEHTPSID